MLKLILKEVTGAVAEYYYQPKCKGRMGLVAFDFELYELTIIEEAEFDDEDNCIYIATCCTQIRDFFKSGDFPKEKICKW